MLSPHLGDTIPGWELAPPPPPPPPLSCASTTTPEGPSFQAGPDIWPEGVFCSRPEPSPPPAAQGSSPQLSLASRIKRSMFSCDPIPGNVNYRAKDFHGESHYVILALAVDPRFRDSMQLVQRYSLLPFMSLRQFFYPWVVLEFFHTMTSWGVSDQMQIRFSIDGRPGILRASDITAALGLPVVLANSTYYR